MQVAELWRYPVKSMGGERLAVADVAALGLVGDRGWGVRDRASGHVLTARREPRLLFAHATIPEPGRVSVVLPDGTETDRDEDLSAWLGREVALESAGAGPVLENPDDAETELEWGRWEGAADAWHDSDRARVSLVSWSTIGEWDRRRFRSNLVVDGDGEDDLVGRRVTVGSCVLDVGMRIPRCVMVTRPQPGLSRELDVLRTVNRERDGCLAVGCLVVRPGTIAVGDTIGAPGPASP